GSGRCLPFVFGSGATTTVAVVTNDPAVKDVPLSGGATLRGAAGTVTVQWLTFGSVADAELTTVDMIAMPDGPVDPELAGLTGQTLAQVAADLTNQGVAL